MLAVYGHREAWTMGEARQGKGCHTKMIAKSHEPLMYGHGNIICKRLHGLKQSITAGPEVINVNIGEPGTGERLEYSKAGEHMDRCTAELE